MTSRDVKQSFRAYPTALARERTMSAVSFLSSVRGAPVLARRAKQSDGARALPAPWASPPRNAASSRIASR